MQNDKQNAERSYGIVENKLPESRRHPFALRLSVVVLSLSYDVRCINKNGSRKKKKKEEENREKRERKKKKRK